jgi:hypothetical protein
MAAAVAVALADAPGGASFAVGGYAPISGAFGGPGADVLLLPAQADATSIATAGNTALPTNIQRRRRTSDVLIRSGRTASAEG